MANTSKVAVFIFGLDARRMGGIEVHTREVVRRLCERDWQAILCFIKEPSLDIKRYLSLPNVTFETLPNAWKNSWQTARDLWRILRRYRPSLMHVQFTTFLSFHAWIAHLSGVRRIIYTDHNSRPEGHCPRPAPFWKRAIGRLLTHPVSLVIGVSEYNCWNLATQGFIPCSRVHRIYNGVDLRRFDAVNTTGKDFRQRYGIPADCILVTQVSWLIPEKGISDVLEAARLALDQEPFLYFAFVGDGKYRDEYVQRALDMGISDHVIWTGLVVDPIGEGVFAATDILCQASRWQEAFGLAIAEGMGFGKVVLATCVGGIPEVVLDGKTGVLSSRGDAATLAKNIIKLARNRKLRERLGQAGRQRAEAEFDVCKNVSVLIELYGLR